MRQIKFRGLSVDQKQWAYGFVVIVQNRAWILQDIGGIAIEVNPKSVGQFTGLSSKGGVDIFEGDVVYLAGYGDCCVDWPFLDLFEASFEGDIGEIEGNIHQHPELLK